MCADESNVCAAAADVAGWQVTVFADSLISTVQRAVCDPLPEVRESAARTFDNLHSNIGPRALDDIIPHLLKKLVTTQLLC